MNAEIREVEARAYPAVEHLLIVQVGLKDVFAFFDAIK